MLSQPPLWFVLIAFLAALGPLIFIHEYAGDVRPRHETRLAFRVPGKITERLVEVRHGCLAELEQRDPAAFAR